MEAEKIKITQTTKMLIFLFLIVLALTLAVSFSASLLRLVDGAHDSDSECTFDKNVSLNVCP